MISLAHMEMVTKELNIILKNADVAAVKAFSERFKNPKKPHYDIHKLIGSRFKKITRRGKAIVMHLNNCVAACRLGRSGVWKVYYNDNAIPQKNVAFIIYLIHQQYAKPIKLVLFDARACATMEIRRFEKDCESLRNYGPEPLSSAFNIGWIDFVCERKDIPIKLLLMRQEYFAGFDNMSACEALFRANLHPLLNGCDLIEDQKERLLRACKWVMNAIGSRHESHLEGAIVNYVYGREKSDCYVCGSAIDKFTVLRRGTYYCPKCQAEDWSDKVSVSRDIVNKIAQGGAVGENVH